jgi:hypothetical protein
VQWGLRFAGDTLPQDASLTMPPRGSRVSHS